MNEETHQAVAGQPISADAALSANEGEAPEPDDIVRPAEAEAVDTASDASDATEITTESVVEAILFSSDLPLAGNKIARVLGVGDARAVKKHVATLNAKYEQMGASFRIEEQAGGFRMLTLPAYNNWVSKLHAVRRETRLSQAALETLAVVAYKQPVLRADIEAVRGVAVGDVLNRLREMGLVKSVGRAEVVGRPMLYGTTRKFLEVFGLGTLENLPKVDALAMPGGAAGPAEPAEPQDAGAQGNSRASDPSNSESTSEAGSSD
ncbi:MAG: SMC-Scp complex subunit ScpB [bacterium]|nr:SMC-Scp complex subunit ScpB [bacterium]